MSEDMPKITDAQPAALSAEGSVPTRHSYAPRFPNHNAGFTFIVISFVFIYTLLSLLAIGIANNPTPPDPNHVFNLPFAIGTVIVALLLFFGSVQLTRRLLQNTPRRIILDANLFWVEDEQGQKLVEIPYNQVRQLEEADRVLTEGQYNARYRGLLIVWQSQTGDSREFLLSARNTCDFEEMMDDLFPRVPEAARGERTFDR